MYAVKDLVRDHFLEENGFCYAEWEALHKRALELPKTEEQAFYTNLVTAWLQLNAHLAGEDYRIVESKNFRILTAVEDRIAREFTGWFERGLDRTWTFLGDLAAAPAPGPLAVIVFQDDDSYLSYVSYFEDDSVEAVSRSGGMFIQTGYPHFTYPRIKDRAWFAEETFVHELTHSLVAHLELPVWIDEGLAMKTAEQVAGAAPQHLDRELRDEHLAYWTPATIQDFWSGASWSMPGIPNQLSYSLASILFHKFENDLAPAPGELESFFARAQRKDAGETACRELFDYSLDDFVADFLGDGDWAPRPENWR